MWFKQVNSVRLICIKNLFPVFSDFTRQQQNIRAGDGSFQISQLLLKLRSSNIQNQVLVDELSPKIGMNSNGCRKKNGISDDALKEKVERKKKAMARQKKILAEFMSKQEVFKEQNITSGTNSFS